MTSMENPKSAPTTTTAPQGEAEDPAGDIQSKKRGIDEIETESDPGTGQHVKRIKGKKNRGGKTRGGNFLVEEVLYLLSNLEEVLPLGGFEWEHVLTLHERKYPNQGRTADGLRRKFHALANGKGPGGPVEGPDYFARAKTLRLRLAGAETAHGDIEKTTIASDEESGDEEGPNITDSVAELGTQPSRNSRLMSPRSAKLSPVDRRLELDLKIQLSKLELERMKVEREGRKDFLEWTTLQMERHHQLMLAMLKHKSPMQLTEEEDQNSSEK